MDVDGYGLHERGLRDIVGYLECIGRDDYVYGSGECANTCDCDADGSIRNRWEQDRGNNDHCDSSSTCGRGGESDERVGADRANAKCYGNVDERFTE